MTIRPLTTRKLAAMAVALSVALAPALAEAKPGSSGSVGSRGARTNSPPAATQTAPNAAAPIQRTMTPQTQPGVGQAARPATPAAAAPAAGGFLGSTLGRGLMAGLVGAGIFGLLSGSGLFSGLGSMSSIFGLLLQIGLIFLAVKLVMGFIARRRQGQMATATPDGGMNPGLQRDAFGGMFGGGGASASGPAAGASYGAAQAAPVNELEVSPDDFAAFERKLSEIQSAYGEEDLNRLRRNVTPEIASYFAEDLAENARKGVINKVSGAKLLSGDLSEAWSEGHVEYATVAMHFSVMDTIVERATGAYVSGDRTEPSESTEIWTFTRPAGAAPDDWKLSAIQQAA
jgi:predicted lipid-binding transport protein (Tim44 family)